MTTGVGIAYNRWVTMRGQMVSIVHFIEEEPGNHETKYAENPHDAYWEFAQTGRCATDVRSPGSRGAD
jgi:hypothetical protein